MITLCTILSPFVNISQQMLNLIWFPIGLFGLPTPSLGGFLGPIVGCTF